MNGSRSTSWRSARLLASGAAGLGLVLGSVAGFVAALLRRRPLTSYAETLRQPLATEDPDASNPAERR